MYAGGKHWNLKGFFYMTTEMRVYSCLIEQCEKNQDYTTGWFRSYEYMSKTEVWLIIGMKSGW